MTMQYGFVDDVMFSCNTACVTYGGAFTAEGCQSVEGNAERGGVKTLHLRPSALAPAD